MPKKILTRWESNAHEPMHHRVKTGINPRLPQHKVELKEMVFTVLCDCGRSFRAEDFEPECPFCDRKYIVEIEGNSRRINLKSILFKQLH